MASETFYVSVKTPRAAIVYAFTRSVTGILDYAGEATPTVDDLSQMQCVEGSAYFTPSWYTYLPSELQASVHVYLPCNVENLDVGQYSFLLHVGALLLAVQEGDGGAGTQIAAADANDDQGFGGLADALRGCFRRRQVRYF